MKRNGIGILMFLEVAIYFSSTAMTAKCGNERINKKGCEANITEAPWTVALMEKWDSYLGPPEELSAFCTGSIIDAKWILTAARCVLKYRPNPSDMTVLAGIDYGRDLNNESLWGRKIHIRTAKKIHYHPNYQPEVIGTSDTALVQVDPFNFTNRVQPVVLWNSEWPGLGALVTCKAFGWGLISKKKTHVLRKAVITAQHGKCDCVFKRIAQRRSLCSHPLSAGGLCGGDWGGPLICDEKLTGVASSILNRDGCSIEKIPLFDFDRNLCNSPSAISLWVYVCPMLKFINHHVPTVPVQPENCSGVRFVANIGFIILSAIFFHQFT